MVSGSTRRTILHAATAGLLALAVVTSCSKSSDVATDGRASIAGVGLEQVPLRLAPAMAALPDGRVFLAGGSEPPTLDSGFLSDAYIVNLQDSTAESIPPAPTSHPLRMPSAVALGSEVVLVGVQCSESASTADSPQPVCIPGTPFAARFDSLAGTWSAIPLPEELAALGKRGEPVFVAPMGALGDSMAVFQIGTSPGDFWVFDTREESWRRIGRAPVAATPSAPIEAGYAGSLIDACLAGDRIIAIESTRPLDGLSGGSGAIGVRSHVVAINDEMVDWVPGPLLADHEFLSIPRIDCMNERVLLSDGAGVENGLWMAATSDEGWSTVEAPSLGYPAIARVWTGRELVFVDPSPRAASNALDPTTAKFRRVQGGPGTITLWSLYADPFILGVSESSTGDVKAGQLVYRDLRS